MRTTKVWSMIMNMPNQRQYLLKIQRLEECIRIHLILIYHLSISQWIISPSITRWRKTIQRSHIWFINKNRWPQSGRRRRLPAKDTTRQWEGGPMPWMLTENSITNSHQKDSSFMRKQQPKGWRNRKTSMLWKVRLPKIESKMARPSSCSLQIAINKVKSIWWIQLADQAEEAVIGIILLLMELMSGKRLGTRWRVSHKNTCVSRQIPTCNTASRGPRPEQLARYRNRGSPTSPPSQARTTRTAEEDPERAISCRLQAMLITWISSNPCSQFKLNIKTLWCNLLSIRM